jgi:lysophospholipase L1-like esterase
VPFKNQLNLIKKTCVINYLYQKLLQFKLNELIKTYQERMILSSDTNITATQYLRHNFRGYFSTYTGEINYLSTKDPQSGNSILFIPQILNYPMLETQKGETFSYWMPGVSEQFACIMTKDINNLLAHMYPQHTEMYNQVQTGWQEEDFLDNGHFSIAGSHKFADKILPGVITIINNNQAGKHK